MKIDQIDLNLIFLLGGANNEKKKTLRTMVYRKYSLTLSSLTQNVKRLLITNIHILTSHFWLSIHKLQINPVIGQSQNRKLQVGTEKGRKVKEQKEVYYSENM